ncbi:hypothetical protein [Mangrovicoccus algicola]|uniref:Uncharacterized protein n=1 Tax=Mangrovicoccus algicola TaxID=2771008 RepID=A0A8J6ZAF8_9RHOB|nr:hypothetical protein [Mangrovicoccus algicola]MBE3639380.1 hypothetical protein [Mangrovicoccus algicola]
MTAARPARACLLPALAVLAACSGDAGPADPGRFALRFGEREIEGRYDPAGFDSAEARRATAQVCAGTALARYEETGRADGRRDIAAACESFTKVNDGTAVFTRRDDGRIRVQINSALDGRSGSVSYDI